MKPRTRATMWTLLIAFALMTTGSFVNVAAQESAATLKDVQRFLGEWVIVEVKFTRHVPRWMGTVHGRFQLKPQACSKYCTAVAELLGEDAGTRRRRYA